LIKRIYFKFVYKSSNRVILELNILISSDIKLLLGMVVLG